MKKGCSYPKEKIKIVLLENIHPAAAVKLRAVGYSVEEIKGSLSSDELLEVIRDTHVLGIRSKTKVTAEHFAEAKKLLTVGCFGVGTNQVDIDVARSFGVPVFNAPFASTRSVAELAVAYILMLSRGIGARNCKMHHGRWSKSAKGSHEIRHKVLGLIGYGHIGQQVGLMAESLGMQVLFYDKTKKLPLGNARPYDDMAEVLKRSDFVSVHIPASPTGEAVFGSEEMELMKPGACLLNLSRGSIVSLPALKAKLEAGYLAGAALDVFPNEPGSSEADFTCELTSVEQAILTPHIGGSTEEAQENIGLEVAASFVQFIDGGATSGAVNFPQIDLPEFPNSSRILNVHENVPGVLNQVNRIIADLGANINAQYLSTYRDVGYLIVDLNDDVADEVCKKLNELSISIRTRILY